MKIFNGSQLKFGTSLCDIEVPAFLHARLSTGQQWLDEMLGSNRWGANGFVASTAFILTGDPGAGKSTLAFTIACGLADGHLTVATPEAERDSRTMSRSELAQVIDIMSCPDDNNETMVFYNSTEESAQQIVMRGQRLGLDRSNLMLGDENEIITLITRMDAAIAERRSQGWTGMPILVLDSLQSMSYNGSQSASALSAGYSLLVGWCKAQKGVFLAINQMTKSGHMAGSNKVKHACDTHMYLAVLSDKEMEDLGIHDAGSRVLRTRKNRFGSTGENWIVALGEAGFTPIAREIVGMGK